MKIHLFILLLLFVLSSRATTKVTLSKEATISILTCAPGDELYSLFGHTGIRVKDPVKGIDLVFNYGTFDFNTQGFYFKFARGLLPYQLSASYFHSFMMNYMMEKRSVYSQTLVLDSIQKQLFMDLLMENYRPENRSYLYNFLFNNCTTRARDLIQESMQDKITWTSQEQNKSFWNLLDEYLQSSPWIQWGIHTILGSPANADATNWEQMFLPDYLMYGLDSAYHHQSRLVEPVQTLYQAPVAVQKRVWYFSPTVVFLACALFLVLLLQRVRNNRLLKIMAMFFFFITGIIGCLILFLGFFTAHPTTAPNLNILWANPINLIILFFINKHAGKWVGKYLSLYLVLLVAGVLVWLLFVPATLPSTLIIIAWMIYLSVRVKQYLRSLVAKNDLYSNRRAFRMKK